MLTSGYTQQKSEIYSHWENEWYGEYPEKVKSNELNLLFYERGGQILGIGGRYL